MDTGIGIGMGIGMDGNVIYDGVYRKIQNGLWIRVGNGGGGDLVRKVY